MKRLVRRAILPCLLMGITLTACRESGKPGAGTAEASPDSLMITVEDSTLYGIAGEHGMSSFCLITDSGDTLLMSRTSEDGAYGAFYGSITEGNRYAVVATDDREAVAKAINITELNRFVKHYSIFNGLLIFYGDERRDTVQILSLSRDSLVVSYADGHAGSFLPRF